MSASYEPWSVVTWRAAGSIAVIRSCRNSTPGFARSRYCSRTADAPALPKRMSSFEKPNVKPSFWSISVTRTSSATESERRLASSSPPNPAPRITTCLTRQPYAPPADGAGLGDLDLRPSQAYDPRASRTPRARRVDAAPGSGRSHRQKGETMKLPKRGVRVACVAILVASAIALAVSATSGAGRAAAHAMTPAVGTSPHAKLVGVVDGVKPNVHFSCQDTAGCYDPTQMREAYGCDQLDVDGTGRTIVIVDAFQSPTIQQDLSLFDSVFGLPAGTLNIIAPDGLTPFDANDDNQVG